MSGQETVSLAVVDVLDAPTEDQLRASRAAASNGLAASLMCNEARTFLTAHGFVESTMLQVIEAAAKAGR